MKNNCPSTLTANKKNHSKPAEICAKNGKQKFTSGNPLAKAMYGLAILSLTKKTQNPLVNQKWYDDDGNTVENLKTWENR